MSNRTPRALVAGGSFSLALVLAPSALWAQTDVPHVFVSGEKALASEVNQNFDTLETAIDTKQDRVSGICAVGSSIRSIAADGTVVCDEHLGANSVGSAEIAPNAVGSSEIASGAVGSDEIADGAIRDADISSGFPIGIDKITGEAGAEFGSFAGPFSVGTTIFDLGSITVNAPRAGFVIVTLTGTASLNENGDFNFGIGVDDDSAYSGGTGAAGIKLTPAGTGTIQFSDHPFSMTRGFVVSAGAVDFHALADTLGIFGGTATVTDVDLTAIFLPTRY